MTVDSVARDVTHPLEPLSVDEIRAATAIMRAEGAFGEGDRLVALSLREPPKEAVLAHRLGDPVMREAKAVLLVRGHVREVDVSLTGRETGVTRQVEDIAETSRPRSRFRSSTIARLPARRVRYQEALAKRGITDVSKVNPSIHGRLAAMAEATRPASAVSPAGCRGSGSKVPTTTPTRTRSTTSGHRGPQHEWRSYRRRRTTADAVPKESGNYLPEYVAEARTDLKPIEITQPEGAPFTVTGNHVQWPTGPSAVGFTPREGLVLHQLQFRDKGVERPVINRASLSEMVVPYGDPRPSRPKERLRLRRIQHRQHGQLPDPGLRLPRRNQVLRRSSPTATATR